MGCLLALVCYQEVHKNMNEAGLQGCPMYEDGLHKAGDSVQPCFLLPALMDPAGRS